MYIASSQYPVFKPYNKPAIELYIQGCNRGCVACHNPELCSFSAINNTNDYICGSTNDKVEDGKLHSRRIFYDIISITGGDLLCQDNIEAFEFSRKLKHVFPEKELWLFTGAELDQVPDWAKQIYDWIKTGPYKKELAQDGFPASSNQKLNRKGFDY